MREHGPPAPLAHGVVHVRRPKPEDVAADGADHQVGERQRAAELLERHGNAVSSPATAVARSNVRFATMSVPVPWARSCRGGQLAHGAGADQERRLVAKRSKISFASSTAADPTDTARAAMPVSLRTRFATENDLWKQRCRMRPDAPAAAASAYCVLQLAEDLGLATTMVVEARRDAEEMPDGVARPR
jgi:hypothetical protein